jgi:hypothetical protein
MLFEPLDALVVCGGSFDERGVASRALGFGLEDGRKQGQPPNAVFAAPKWVARALGRLQRRAFAVYLDLDLAGHVAPEPIEEAALP